MPASPMVPASLLAVLEKLRVFTAPGFVTPSSTVGGHAGLVGEGSVQVRGGVSIRSRSRAWANELTRVLL